jgi:fumarate hydratase class II
VTDIRVESDSLGRVEVPADKLWGAQTQRSLMLVRALSPVIGYDKASAIAHKAHNEDLSLKEAAIRSGYVDEKQFDEIVDPRKMVGRPVAAN